jgi:hypothetical protein
MTRSTAPRRAGEIGFVRKLSKEARLFVNKKELPSRPKIKKISKNKQFFFEKKNQKTFAPLREIVPRPPAKNC